ncbi:MAG TPA: dihydrolipoyl dehydrogenase [Pseudogracilibacillus sp.]|uniref:Dihydrolipoyl dehydrogenase n=1 Tax=Candidatus Pseudogracilibacillus intestinigallinarum TaxID=2838742 RepID=A0A9D1PKX6_9BACI|nr:dihydrolipoyl dehydrogenase [Candidatus Pseudogracilibacillus intestinigallinarum]HLR41712.1 dihydrolipoyl dehydrogenase [Pseudogracilibacillus sp.]
MKKFDVIVIGAGPGGYVTAIRSAQLGKKVALIEKEKVGGTCLHVGCIPSKTYIHVAAQIESARQMQQYGVTVQDLRIDFSKVKEKKDKVISRLEQGVTHLCKKNNITMIYGEAQIKDSFVTVEGETYTAKDIVIATGSRPFIPNIKGLDEIEYITTDSFFSIQTLPKTMCIIGGGVIAVELASALALMNVHVTIIEVAEDILLSEDKEARGIVKKRLQKNGIDIITNTKIKEVKQNVVSLLEKDIPYEKLLIATGRIPNVEIIQNEQLEMNGKFIAVNCHFETSKGHIYAIGDITGGYQLAHAAIMEGIYVAEKIAGKLVAEIKENDIPRCVYTTPEIASIGISEEKAKELGYDVQVSTTMLNGNGKAISNDATDGFVKIISEKKYGEILGAVIVSKNATEMIHAILGMKYVEGTIEELASMTWAHPTLSEVIFESANNFFGKAIHM